MDDIKNIWNRGVDNRFNYYSESELKEIVVKSAHKSMRRIYPSVTLMVLFVIAILLLIYSIAFDITTDAMRIVNSAVLLFLAICFFFWVRSYRIMHQYNAATSTKAWLEYRIKMVQRSLELNVKYDLLITVNALLISFSYYYFFISQLSFPISIWIIVVVTVGNAIFVLRLRNSVIAKYRKTLKELNKLYNQLDDKSSSSSSY